MRLFFSLLTLGFSSIILTDISVEHQEKKVAHEATIKNKEELQKKLTQIVACFEFLKKHKMPFSSDRIIDNFKGHYIIYSENNLFDLKESDLKFSRFLGLKKLSINDNKNNLVPDYAPPEEISNIPGTMLDSIQTALEENIEYAVRKNLLPYEKVRKKKFFRDKKSRFSNQFNEKCPPEVIGGVDTQELILKTKAENRELIIKSQ